MQCTCYCHKPGHIVRHIVACCNAANTISETIGEAERAGIPDSAFFQDLAFFLEMRATIETRERSGGQIVADTRTLKRYIAKLRSLAVTNRG